MATSLDKAQPTSDKASDASTLRLPTTHHPTVTSGQTSSTTSFSDTDPKDVEKNELVGDEATKEIAEAAPAVAGQTPPINPMHPSQFPDGGTRAWLVVFGAHCALFVSFGRHSLVREDATANNVKAGSTVLASSRHITRHISSETTLLKRSLGSLRSKHSACSLVAYGSGESTTTSVLNIFSSSAASSTSLA